MKQRLKKQYNASLLMLRNCVENYREDIWFSKEYAVPSWQIAYHAVFFANIYCSPDEKSIIKWPKEIEDYHFTTTKPYPPFDKVKITKQFTKDEILEYIDLVMKNIPVYLESFEPDKDCWPYWYELTQFEFHINNLRHIQQHFGELLERHDAVENMKYEWLFMRR